MVANFLLCRTFGAFMVSLGVREMNSNCSSFLWHSKVILDKAFRLVYPTQVVVFLNIIPHFHTDDWNKNRHSNIFKIYPRAHLLISSASSWVLLLLKRVLPGLIVTLMNKQWTKPLGFFSFYKALFIILLLSLLAVDFSRSYFDIFTYFL